MTNFGQSNFGQSNIGQSILGQSIFDLMCVIWGPKGWGPNPGGAPKGGAPKGLGPRRVAPKGGAPKGGARRVGGPKFRAFSSLSRHHFALFVSLWVSFRGILVVFETLGPSNVRSPRGPKTVGVSHDSPRAQTCTFRVPVFKNTTKNQREDTQRETRRAKMWAGEGKKKRNFGRRCGWSSAGGSSARVRPRGNRWVQQHNNNTTTTHNNTQQHPTTPNNTQHTTTTQTNITSQKGLALQNWPNHRPLTTNIGQKWIGQSRP